MTTHVCPRCERPIRSDYCCGIDFSTRRPWKMTPDRIKLVHVVKARKGLDDETYRLRLNAVGVGSCKQLTRESFRTFITGLASLPDSPTWELRARG